MNIVLNKSINNKIKKIFLTLNTKINETSKVDIILSPEFYWVRVFELPVKNINQAKSIIPTLFEDIIVESNKLSYYVVKLEEKKYLCFAYINQKIFESIKNSGINLSLVNNIYFAQNECKEFKQFYIHNKSFLYTEDGILVKVPNEVLINKFDLEKVLNNIKLSSHKINIKFYNNSLDKKYINIILFCLFLIFSLNISKYFLYSNDISKIDRNIENIKKNSNLPASMIQINSIINENSKILQKELKNREVLYYILSNEKFNIKDVLLDNDILNVSFTDTNKNEVEKYISSKYKIESIYIKENILNVRIQL
ncbi:hypothetical protein CRU92_04050 [Arcobacter sp. FW59]|nr:hypothetical protein CRU92_04050 [Arcobacter sp. FW59]